MKNSIIYLGDCYKCFKNLKKSGVNLVTIKGIKINQMCKNCLNPGSFKS